MAGEEAWLEPVADAPLAATAAWLDWPPDLAAAVRAAATRFRSSPALTALLRDGHQRLFGGDGRSPRGDWIRSDLGEDAGMLPFLALLTGLPSLRAGWDRRGIPEEVRIETLSDIRLWATVYRANHGTWGLADLGWLMHHFDGTLFRLGRLQAMPGEFPKFAHVFRRRGDGAVTLLCPDGQVYDAGGRAYWRRGETDEPGIWTARLAREGGSVRGHPVTPAGAAAREVVTLSVAAWEEILAPGDPILDLHIPAGEPLTSEACRASVARARAFFPRHCPEHAFKGFSCWAWLLDPVFQQLLPPTANIVQFQALFHLFPVPGNEGQVMERIFGAKRPDLSHAPRGDRLRHAVQAYVDGGGRFAGAGGGVLRTD